MTTDPGIEAFDRILAAELSRRAFLGRSLAVGLATSIAGSLIAACANGDVGPSGPGTPGLPEIVPNPLRASYGPMVDLGRLMCVDIPEGNLRDRLIEIADGLGIELGFGAADASSSRLGVTIDANDLPAQGYRLTVGSSAGRAEIHVRGADEAGAFYGLESLAQLVVHDGPTAAIRRATVTDQPSFERRGAIIDPPQLPYLRSGVPYKMNFLALASGLPPDIGPLLDYARSHYVEVMSMVGYRDQLTMTPMGDLKAILTSQLGTGIRSFCLKWDDIPVRAPDVEAARHGAIFNELYSHLRAQDPAAKVSIVMPPYGGVPGANLFNGEAGRRYLTLMRDRLPDDVVVFWTGDGGVFSETVTADGARSYAALVGHSVGLWDNNALWFINGRRPLWGRATNLPVVIRSYMANMVMRDLAARGTAGQVALFTELQYAWRSETYEPMAACAVAERILREDGSWVTPGSTCAPPVPMGRPTPIDLPAPSAPGT